MATLLWMASYISAPTGIQWWWNFKHLVFVSILIFTSWKKYYALILGLPGVTACHPKLAMIRSWQSHSGRSTFVGRSSCSAAWPSGSAASQSTPLWICRSCLYNLPSRWVPHAALKSEASTKPCLEFNAAPRRRPGGMERRRAFWLAWSQKALRPQEMFLVERNSISNSGINFNAGESWLYAASGFFTERRKLFSERMKLSHKQNPRCLEKDENGKIIGTKSNKQ